MITLEVTTMRGAAASAFFSLGLLSALLVQTRSPGMNASSQRMRRKRGGTHISYNEWGGVGVASRVLESAHFRDVAANSDFVARRRCQTPGTGLGLAGTLTPYRGSGSSEPFGLTLAQPELSLVSCASSSVRRRVSSRSTWSRKITPTLDVPLEIKEQLRMGDPSSVWPVGELVQCECAQFGDFCRSLSQCTRVGGVWTAEYKFWIVDDSSGLQC